MEEFQKIARKLSTNIFTYIIIYSNYPKILPKIKVKNGVKKSIFTSIFAKNQRLVPKKKLQKIEDQNLGNLSVKFISAENIVEFITFENARVLLNPTFSSILFFTSVLRNFCFSLNFQKEMEGNKKSALSSIASAYSDSENSDDEEDTTNDTQTTLGGLVTSLRTSHSESADDVKSSPSASPEKVTKIVRLDSGKVVKIQVSPKMAKETGKAFDPDNDDPDAEFLASPKKTDDADKEEESFFDAVEEQEPEKSRPVTEALKITIQDVDSSLTAPSKILENVLKTSSDALPKKLLPPLPNLEKIVVKSSPVRLKRHGQVSSSVPDAVKASPTTEEIREILSKRLGSGLDISILPSGSDKSPEKRSPNDQNKPVIFF